MYENRIIKPAEIVLRRGEGMREKDGGVNLLKIYYKHTCKHHKVSPVQLLYANKQILACMNGYQNRKGG
jgi:hypothetical protein